MKIKEKCKEECWMEYQEINPGEVFQKRGCNFYFFKTDGYGPGGVLATNLSTGVNIRFDCQLKVRRVDAVLEVG